MSRIEKALEKASELRQKTSIKSDNKTLLNTEYIEESNIGNFPAQHNAIPVSNPILIVATDPSSHISEEYQKLKATLFSLARQGEFNNVLMITSAIPGEGKSVTSINLALSIAKEIDHTVLLIDADLRKPSVDSYLGVKAQLGLTDILEGRAEVEDVLIHTGIGRLVVMPAGKIASNPVELFSSNRMKQLLQELKHRYVDRFIIIDTPPVIPFAETRTLARLVDGVLIVIKENVTPHTSLTEVQSALEGIRILGVVYNEVEIAAGNDRYRYYHNGYRYDIKSSEMVKGTELETL